VCINNNVFVTDLSVCVNDGNRHISIKNHKGKNKNLGVASAIRRHLAAPRSSSRKSVVSIAFLFVSDT
jgi:hypothetical protein